MRESEQAGDGKGEAMSSGPPSHSAGGGRCCPGDASPSCRPGGVAVHLIDPPRIAVL